MRASQFLHRAWTLPDGSALVIFDAKNPPKAEPKKEEPKKEKTAELITQDKEAEAGRKLKYAKQTLNDAERAKGEDREKLFELAQKKLQEVTEKYEGSKAAKEAQDLLDKK